VPSPKTPAKGDRWLLAIVYGLLAELATIATIIAVMMLSRYLIVPGRSEAEYAALGTSVGGYVGTFGGAIFTYIFARRLMPKISARFSEHGLVVALAATTLSIVGSIVGHQGVPAGYLLASVFKFIAGARAGFVHLRSLRVHGGVGASS
jgi:hypothetical protein